MRVIQGIVVPAEWDENGTVVAVAISTRDEEEYLVDSKGKGAELKAVIRENVEVSGELLREGPRKKIRVRSYALKKVAGFSV